MGGRPITAMNVVCFPSKKLGISTLKSILQGGLDILKEAGVALVGGHSVEDDELKYGLSVAGLVHPDRMMTNSALQPGDRLILTKAIGTGIVATALKAQLATASSVDAMVRSLCTLNKNASEVASRFDVKACTDVTGFGLAGHLVEMARAGKCKLRIHAESVPILEGAMEGASMGLIPGGGHSNRKFFGSWVTVHSGISAEIADLMFDPQTSGGLIFGVPGERVRDLFDALIAEGVEPVAEIGEVLEPDMVGHLEIV